MTTRTPAQQAIATTGEFPLTLFAVGLPRGTALHLFDEDDRRSTLCSRRIQINPRLLGLGSSTICPSESATCQRCVTAASKL